MEQTGKYFNRLVIFFFTLLLYQNTFAQEYKCGWYGKKTIEERNKIFPFNKTKKIMLVSYLGTSDGLLKKGDKRDFDQANGIIKTQNIRLEGMEFSYKVKEEVLLDEKEVNDLSDILVNYTLKEKPKGTLLLSEMTCYEPRNSVLFLDENDIVISNFEICFECFKTRMYPDSEINAYSQIEECFSRFKLLKDFFSENGIKYGIEDPK